jgi:hypothetical protein
MRRGCQKFFRFGMGSMHDCEWELSKGNTLNTVRINVQGTRQL